MEIDESTLSPEAVALLHALVGVTESKPEREWGQAPQPNPLTITVKRVKSAADMVSKRARVVAQVGRANYLAGVQTPKKSPMGAAASDAAQKAYVAKVMDPAVQARRQSSLKKRTDTEWLGQVEETGADAYVRRTAATQYKFEQAATTLENEFARIAAIIDAMPNVTLEDRKARSAKQIDEASKLKGKVR